MPTVEEHPINGDNVLVQPTSRVGLNAAVLPQAVKIHRDCARHLSVSSNVQ